MRTGSGHNHPVGPGKPLEKNLTPNTVAHWPCRVPNHLITLTESLLSYWQLTYTLAVYSHDRRSTVTSSGQQGEHAYEWAGPGNWSTHDNTETQVTDTQSWTWPVLELVSLNPYLWKQFCFFHLLIEGAYILLSCKDTCFISYMLYNILGTEMRKSEMNIWINSNTQNKNWLSP